MPIDKEMAKRYPADWDLRRRFIIQYRAKNRCEWCGATDREPHPVTGGHVVLTLAHVWDKRPGDGVPAQPGMPTQPASSATTE